MQRRRLLIGCQRRIELLRGVVKIPQGEHGSRVCGIERHGLLIHGLSVLGLILHRIQGGELEMQGHVLRLLCDRLLEVRLGPGTLPSGHRKRRELRTRLAQIRVKSESLLEGLTGFLVLLLFPVCQAQLVIACGVVRCLLRRCLEGSQGPGRIALTQICLAQDQRGCAIVRLESEQVLP